MIFALQINLKKIPLYLHPFNREKNINFNPDLRLNFAIALSNSNPVGFKCPSPHGHMTRAWPGESCGALLRICLARQSFLARDEFTAHEKSRKAFHFWAIHLSYAAQCYINQLFAVKDMHREASNKIL